MAEIRIERKPQRSFWPWLLGILVLMALLWLISKTFEKNRLEDIRTGEVRNNAKEAQVVKEPASRLVDSYFF